jgi:hypothetical protein
MKVIAAVLVLLFVTRCGREGEKNAERGTLAPGGSVVVIPTPVVTPKPEKKRKRHDD